MIELTISLNNKLTDMLFDAKEADKDATELTIEEYAKELLIEKIYSKAKEN